MKKYLKIILFLLHLFFLGALQADNKKLKELVLELDTKDFKSKITTIEKISSNKSEFTLKTLKAILNGKLYIRKSDKKLIIVNIINREYNTFDFFSDAELGIVKKRKLKKIKINNKIRSILNNKIALLQLSNGTTRQKIEAIFDVIKEGNQETLIIINELINIFFLNF